MNKIKKKRAWIIFMIGLIVTRFTIAEWIENYYVALTTSVLLIYLVIFIVEVISQKKEKKNEIKNI